MTPTNPDIAVTGRTFPGGAPDQEVHDLMARLSDLQTWCVMMARKDSGGIPASQLIQDTRCLIVERLFPSARPHLANQPSNPPGIQESE